MFDRLGFGWSAILKLLIVLILTIWSYNALKKENNIKAIKPSIAVFILLNAFYFAIVTINFIAVLNGGFNGIYRRLRQGRKSF